MKRIKLSNDMLKNISNNEYYSEEQFLSDCKEYISAVKSGRILYTVTHVSNSGMSRNINIQSYSGTMSKGYFRQYVSMLEVLGYKFANNSYDIKVSGYGMNMLFSTNYNIIHTLKSIGLISKKQCEILAQKVN